MAREGVKPFSGTFEVKTTNTAEALSTSSRVITAVLLTAASGNAEAVKVGASTVGAASYPIEAGESIAVDSMDPVEFFLYGKEKDKVYFFGMEPS